MVTKQDLMEIAANTQDVYQRLGHKFDAERVKTLFERPWLEKLAALLPEGADILDAGCGAGMPIAQYFINKGHWLTGIDYADSMIALCQQRFPKHYWQVADMRDFDLEMQFDAILGWHSFFHLTPKEQGRTLCLFAQHLKPGGALLLTVGHEAGEVIGHVGGEPVYHSSLSPSEYRAKLEALDMAVLDFVLEDPECDFATILLAQKRHYKRRECFMKQGR